MLASLYYFFVMEKFEKMYYDAPTIVVVEMNAEGVICASGESNGAHGNGFDGWYNG